MTIATTNPATGVTEKTFTPHNNAEVEERLTAAQAAFESLADTTFDQRAQWMRDTADLLEADIEKVARIITLEMGKPISASRAEVEKSVRGMRFYADNAQAFLADEPLADPSRVGATRAYTTWQPLGVVLAVMPWNYPIWQVIRFAAPALMAGNAGVLKHASNVPQAALYLDDLFARGGFPAGSFSTLLIGSREVAAVIDDPRTVAVTLTGSEPAGKAVASAAAAQVKKAVLELGGSDPFVVMPSADLPAAIETAVTARTANNGQSCIAGKRFIVHTDIYDEFVAGFAASMEKLIVGDPMDENTDIGPLVNESGREEIAELVDDALAKGATALTGGHSGDGVGWFYPPTVITDITTDMRIYHEETFGPVASIYRVADLDEAIALANDTVFGLSSAIWTNNPDEQRIATRKLSAGAVFINGMTASHPELPFGGIKNSGYGRELAADGIREFCNLKTVWVA